MRRLIYLAVVLAAWHLAPASLSGQVPPAPADRFKPQDLLPLDRAIQTATLPNGLKYFVRRNARPEKRVSLRLAVRYALSRRSLSERAASLAAWAAAHRGAHRAADRGEQLAG